MKNRKDDLDSGEVSRPRSETAKMVENYWGTLFEEAHDPKAWLAKARLLKRSADLIMESHKVELGRFEKDSSDFETIHPPDLWIVYMLLAGLALEVTIKAIVLGKDSKGFRSRKYYNHQLIDLIDTAGIKLNAMERRLAKQLFAFVVWAGRYPAPKRKEDMPVSIPGMDVENRFDALFGRVVANADRMLEKPVRN